MLASFDMATVRILHVVFFEATLYACRLIARDNSTLARRLYLRLTERLKTDEPAKLRQAVLDTYDGIVGRTLGPPESEFLNRLCSGDERSIRDRVNEVSPTKRARATAANYFATLPLFAKAAGIRHVLLGCDQLEDFAATNTAKQKRSQETERFRDYVLELQPMADMLSVVVTLHPRAAQVIGTEWRLADLPSFNHADPQNDRLVCVLREITHLREAECAAQTLSRRCAKGRRITARRPLPLHGRRDRGRAPAIGWQAARHPATRTRPDRTAAEENWDIIDAAHASQVLDAIAAHLVDDEAVVAAPTPESVW